MLLFLFTIFFEYACYIFNLYEEKLISKLNKKTSKELIDELRKANQMMIGNFLLLINYSLIRNFELKDDNGEYFSPQEFISVDQAVSESEATKSTESLSKVVRRIRTDKIILDPREPTHNKIRVYFKNTKMYKDFQVDLNKFKPDIFPLVFDTNKLLEPIVTGATIAETFLDINYGGTIRNLTKFLLQDKDGEIPSFINSKTNEQYIIPVGAPMQNNEVFQQTFEALESYYKYIKSSKQVYLQFAQLKINIFRSGFPSETIIKWFTDFSHKFNIIFTSSTIPQKQEIELLKLIKTILIEYKKSRLRELKFLANSFPQNSSKSIGNRMSDLSREEFQGILSVREGLSAVMLITIAKLSYDIFT